MRGLPPANLDTNLPIGPLSPCAVRRRAFPAPKRPLPSRGGRSRLAVWVVGLSSKLVVSSALSAWSLWEFGTTAALVVAPTTQLPLKAPDWFGGVDNLTPEPDHARSGGF